MLLRRGHWERAAAHTGRQHPRTSKMQVFGLAEMISSPLAASSRQLHLNRRRDARAESSSPMISLGYSRLLGDNLPTTEAYQRCREGRGVAEGPRTGVMPTTKRSNVSYRRGPWGDKMPESQAAVVDPGRLHMPRLLR